MRAPGLLSLTIASLACLSASRTAAQPIGPEFRVNSYTTGNESGPRVALDSTGAFVVVWRGLGQDGGGYGIFGQRYDASGAPLGGEFRANSYTTGGQSIPSVAAAAGGFVVVWSSYLQDGSNQGVFGQRFDGGGAPAGSEFRVNTYTTQAQVFADIAGDSSGNFVVMWGSAAKDGAGYGVFGQRYGSAGAPLGGEFRVNTYTTGNQADPSVAFDASGRFVVAWNSFLQDGSSYGVFGQRYDAAGAPLGAEFRVSSYTTNQQALASVAAAPNGDFVVVWQSLSQDGSIFGAFGARFASSGAPLGSEFRVAATTTSDQRAPVVSGDETGFTVAWSSYGQDGSNDGVFAQRYDAGGAPLGSEFRVNSYTTGSQSYLQIARKTGGDFIVTWTSTPQDGDGPGVFAQRFCPPLSTVAISAMGTTTVCTTSTGGVATVTDTGGLATSHQWGYRMVSGGPFLTAINGATGFSYAIAGADFPGAGTYYLVCVTFPECGTFMISNEIAVTVTTDGVMPVVTAPLAATVTQTLCQ